MAVILGPWAAACAGEVGGGVLGDGGAEDAPASGAFDLEILAPTEGSAFTRDQLGAGGAMVAPVAFRARGGEEIASVEWRAEGTFALGAGAPPDFAITYDFVGDGQRWVEAVGFDAGGAEVTRATVAFTVQPGTPKDCQSLLTSLGVTFTPGPETMGVPDPVTVTLPIRGIAYRYVSNTTPRSKWMMDCQLAVALWRAGEIFAAHGVVEVADYGIYNYRCINQSVDPPDCPGSQLSMHAYAQAIDIAGLKTADGTFYSVNDDWVIDPVGEKTCEAATSGDKDAFLHAVVCDLYGDEVFNIYLTPNYNSAHRNHWHLDLTAGADFIRKRTSGDDR